MQGQNTVSLVNLGALISKERFSKTLLDSVRLVKSPDSPALCLKVASDMGISTEFFDLQKQLKNKAVVFETQYCDRKALEQLSHLTASQQKAHDDDDERGFQASVIEMISRAVALRASDIHLCIESQAAYCHFRVDGKLVFDRDYPAEQGRRLVNALYNSMCEERSSTSLSYSEPADAKIREAFVQHLGLSTGRFASRPGGGGKLLVVIRLITRRRERLAFDALGLTPPEAAIIRRVLNKPGGVIFSSGPTGHGKSTLSQCMAEMITAHDKGLSMITIEDPIESPIEGAFQTPLIIADRGDRALLSRAWELAISNVVRLNPDWLYIGEVRDATSAMGTLEAGNTGHGVITTIHTRFPIDILSRLKNWKVDKDLLMDATIIPCLIGLRLVPLLCPACKKPYATHKAAVESTFRGVIDTFTRSEQVFLRDNAGCEQCHHTGLKGRTGVFEVIETNAEFMQRYHTQGKQAAYEYWYTAGGITLCDNVLRLVNSGVIDPVDTHRAICNLDRNHLIFSDSAKNVVKTSRQLKGRDYYFQHNGGSLLSI